MECHGGILAQPNNLFGSLVPAPGVEPSPCSDLEPRGFSDRPSAGRHARVGLLKDGVEANVCEACSNSKMICRPKSSVNATPTVSKLARGPDRLARAFREVRLRDEWAYLFLEGVSRVAQRPSGPRARASRGGAGGVRGEA